MRITKINSPRVQVVRPAASAGRTHTAPAPPAKKRVAAYARTSTDHADQETSFEAQQRHFRSVIEANLDMELVDIYADEESGTRAFKRENFMRMIRDCEEGKIDLVLTKSISRWARNTLDSLKYIRKLKALGIGIIFTKEGINTMNTSGEILTTIMSSIAQQESASISQNVQIGVRYHYQEGKVCSGVHRPLGYARTRDGSLEIIPEEAEIVRRIFREYLDGYNPSHIAERLTADGVDGTKTTASGIELPRTWNVQGIEYILKNEKYSGDLLLQKYYTVDFLTKKVAVNNGQVPQYYVENSHPAVIPKEIFMQVQAETVRRKADSKRFRYMHGNGLSGRIICGDCGTPFRIRHDGDYDYWRCETKLNKKRYPGVVCSQNHGIRDDAVKQAVVEAFNRLPDYREELVRLEERIRWGGLNRADEALTEIEGRLAALEQTLRESGEEPDAQTAEMLESLEAEWKEASSKRAEYADAALQIRNLRERTEAINGMPPHVKVSDCKTAEDFLRITRAEYSPGKVMAFSDDEAIKFIERIVIDEKTVTVVFKAGIEITVGR